MLIDLWYRLFPFSFFEETKVHMHSKNSVSYKYGKLENGIRVLMIKSNSKDENEMINISVAGGFRDNPIDVPGLTHLLEHAIFSIDSENFEYEPRKFIEWNDGKFDGNTGFSETNFSIEIKKELAAKAYEMLASMFQKSEISQKIIDYSAKIVDIEYYYRANLNACRYYAYLIANSNSKTHNGFSCGNLDFLDRSDIYDLVNNLYRSTFVAENMVIVVMSSRSFRSQLRSLRPFLNIPKRKIDIKNNLKVEKIHKKRKFSEEQKIIDEKSESTNSTESTKSIKSTESTNLQNSEERSNSSKNYSKTIRSNNSGFAFSEEKKGWIVLTDQNPICFTLIIEIPRIPEYNQVNPQTAFFHIVNSTLKYVLISQKFECTFELEISNLPKSIGFALHFSLNQEELKNYKKLIDFIYQYFNQIEITQELYILISDFCSRETLIHNPEEICKNIHWAPPEFALVKDIFLLHYDGNVISKFLEKIRDFKNWIIIVKSESLEDSSEFSDQKSSKSLSSSASIPSNSIISFEKFFDSPEKFVVFYRESEIPTEYQKSHLRNSATDQPKNCRNNHFENLKNKAFEESKIFENSISPKNKIRKIKQENKIRKLNQKKICRTNPGNYPYVLDEKIAPKPFPEKISIPKILPTPSITVESRNLKKLAKRNCVLRDGILQKKLSFKNGTIFFIFDDESYPSLAKIRIIIKSAEIRKNALKIAAFILKKSMSSKIMAQIDHKTFDIILLIKDDAENIVNVVLEFFVNLNSNISKNDVQFDPEFCLKLFNLRYAFGADLFSLTALAYFDHYVELVSGVSKEFFLENSVEFPSYYFTDIIVVGDLELSDVLRLEKIFSVKSEDFIFTNADTKNASKASKIKEIGLQKVSKIKSISKFRAVRMLKILGPGFKNFIVSKLLEKFLDPIIFKVLRNDLRLAYCPNSIPIYDSGQSYWCFDFFTELEKKEAFLRIEETIKYGIEVLKNLPVNEFKGYFKNKRFIDKENTIWSIACFLYDFDLFEKGLLKTEKVILKTITPQDLIEALESKRNIFVYDLQE